MFLWLLKDLSWCGLWKVLASLIRLIVVLIAVGLALWIIAQIPMDATIARIIRVVIIVCVLIWLLPE